MLSATSLHNQHPTQPSFSSIKSKRHHLRQSEYSLSHKLIIVLRCWPSILASYLVAYSPFRTRDGVNGEPGSQARQTSNVSLRKIPIWGFLILTDRSTTSNAQSPLLKLPQEIKDQIYVLVCGGNLLHIMEANKSRCSNLVYHFALRHVKCVSRTTEEEAQASFEASKSPWFDEVNVSRHKECCSSALALDLRSLRTCHQIYDEARSFCYTDNTFSFDDWYDLLEFVKTVTRMSYVRSIRITSCRVFDSDMPFNREKLQGISNKLTGLQRIHIDWKQTPPHLRKYDQGAGEAIHPTQPLLCFGGIGLKAATVIISDAQFYKNESHSLHRWTMTQKQEYSRFLRDALLQRRGK